VLEHECASSSEIEAVGVVMPAQNHADTIAQCILSIFSANSYAGWRHSLWIVVVADACRDRTVKVARDAVGAFGEVLQVAVQSNGTARGIGAGTVFEHFHHKPRRAILLANADANTCVSRDWIDIQLKTRKCPRGTDRSREQYRGGNGSIGLVALNAAFKLTTVYPPKGCVRLA
jgi:glycosyltransferase involved in cell wall biosynthesis